MILEVACTWELVIAEREREKKLRYQELAADLTRQNPGYRTKVVPVVVGDMGTKGRLRPHLRESRLFKGKQVDELVKEMQREVICSSIKLMWAVIVKRRDLHNHA